jgi:MFS family permease
MLNPAVERASRVRLIVLFFACTLSLITYLDRVCISQVQEDIQRDLGLSEMQLGMVFSAFVLGYALLEVPGGYLGDIWGARLVLSLIVLWWSLWTALTGCVWLFHLDSGWWLGPVPLLFNSFLLMLLIRFIFGAGEAGAFPNLTRVVSTWFPYRERARAQGAIWMSARLGGALAPVLISELAASLGWRPAFWVLGLIGCAWCIGFYWWYRDRPEDMPSCNDAEREWIRTGRQPEPEHPVVSASPAAVAPSLKEEERVLAYQERQTDVVPPAPPAIALDPLPPDPSPEKDVGHSWPPLRVMATSVTLWALCIAAACVSFGWWFYPTWQPRYLKEVHGITFRASAVAAALPFLCGAVGSFLGGGLSDWLVRRLGSRRWGRSLVGVVSFTGAGVCVLLTGFAMSQTQAVVLLCLAFFINDLGIPPIWAASADVGGRFAGTVAGVMNMAGGIGAFLSPLLTPIVLEALPTSWEPIDRWRWIFAGLAGAWFIGAIAWLFVDAGRPLFKEQ